MRIFSWQFFSFLLFFTLMYGGMNLYFFLKWRAAFVPRPRILMAGAFALFFLLLSPMLIPRTAWIPVLAVRQIYAFIGYSWMGFLLQFCFLAGILDLAGFFLSVCGAGKGLLSQELQAGLKFVIPVVLTVIFLTYGFFEARSIRLETVKLVSPKLPGNIKILRLVQISDLHLGILDDVDRLARILERVREAKPDLLVCTGDLFDGQLPHPEETLSMLQAVSPAYGKFAVTGNHEVYAGLASSAEFLASAGFRLLRAEGVHLPGLMNIVGVDDDAVGMYGGPAGRSEKDLFAALPPGFFSLLLKHRPWINDDTPDVPDLQLSGHTHGGQIFPFGFVTGLANGQNGGLLTIRGKRLYVSRGSGTWGPPFRFLTPPEVTLFEIVRE